MHKILYVVLFPLFISACGNNKGNSTKTDNENESIKENSLVNQIQKKPDFEDFKNYDEAHYNKAAAGDLKSVYNARFNFSFDIPLAWRAVNKSENNDGYFIETGNSGADLRVYGANLDPTIEELGLDKCDESKDFIFTDEQTGQRCIKGKKIYYYRDGSDARITFFVDAPKEWIFENRDKIIAIAKSLRFAQKPPA